MCFRSIIQTLTVHPMANSPLTQMGRTFLSIQYSMVNANARGNIMWLIDHLGYSVFSLMHFWYMGYCYLFIFVCKNQNFELVLDFLHLGFQVWGPRIVIYSFRYHRFEILNCCILDDLGVEMREVIGFEWRWLRGHWDSGQEVMGHCRYNQINQYNHHFLLLGNLKKCLRRRRDWFTGF